MNIKFKKIFFIFLAGLLLSSLIICSAKSQINNLNKEYEAIVLGTMIKKKVKKSGNFYITEYKLKTKKWLFKNPLVKKSKYLTIKVLGAELPEKGIVIKASTTPNYIPMNKEAIFCLEKTKSKKDNVYTITKGGIISKKIKS